MEIKILQGIMFEMFKNLCSLYTVRGKILEGENFGEFGERLAIRQNFPPIFINARVFNKLPTDSPKFSSPKTLEPLIRQKFPPPKFSHIQ